MPVGPFQANCYLVHDEASGEGCVIDPGAEEERILARVAELGFRPRYLLLTHGHGDHIGAVPAVAAALRCPIYIHPADAPMLRSPAANLSAFAGVPVSAEVPFGTYEDGDELALGERTIRVLHTPGHSPGGVSLFLAPDVLFSGDALFRRSIGRTDFPGGSYAALRRAIEEKIFPLGDAVVVHPGHEGPTTVGEERRENPFLRPE
jgi:glyoxylase-like metal-dependent hydrolase (beta-lactamase superfamily II)